jgi:hypothetical protein
LQVHGLDFKKSPKFWGPYLKFEDGVLEKMDKDDIDR